MKKTRQLERHLTAIFAKLLPEAKMFLVTLVRSLIVAAEYLT